MKTVGNKNGYLEEPMGKHVVAQCHKDTGEIILVKKVGRIKRLLLGSKPKIHYLPVRRNKKIVLNRWILYEDEKNSRPRSVYWILTEGEQGWYISLSLDPPFYAFKDTSLNPHNPLPVTEELVKLLASRQLLTLMYLD